MISSEGDFRGTTRVCERSGKSVEVGSQLAHQVVCVCGAKATVAYGVIQKHHRP